MNLSLEEKEKRRLERYKKWYKSCHKEIAGVIYKQCSICKEWFIAIDENFYKNKGNQEGLSPYCKPCEIEKNQEYRKDNFEKYKKLDEKRYRDNPNYYKENAKKYYSENTEKRKEDRKRFERNNPDKIKRYGQYRDFHKKHDMNNKEWENCKAYFNYECAYCGLPIDEHYIKYRGNIKLGDFHKEHICDCGRNDLRNCIPACKQCNSEKNVKAFNDWYNSSNPKYTYERYHKIYQWIRYDYKKYIIKKKKQN